MHKTINKQKKQEKPLVCHSNDGDGRIKKKHNESVQSVCVSERCERNKWFERESHLYIIYSRLYNTLVLSLTLSPLLLLCVYEFILLHILDPSDQIRTVTAKHGITKPQQRHHSLPSRTREREKMVKMNRSALLLLVVLSFTSKST